MRKGLLYPVFILDVIYFWIVRVCLSVELFGGSYYVTATNYLCADKDKVPIEDLQDCKEAAKTIPDVGFYKKENSQRHPTGCYITGKGVYFNTHANGSRQEKSGSICRSIGKYNINSPPTNHLVVHKRLFSPQKIK